MSVAPDSIDQWAEGSVGIDRARSGWLAKRIAVLAVVPAAVVDGLRGGPEMSRLGAEILSARRDLFFGPMASTDPATFTAVRRRVQLHLDDAESCRRVRRREAAWRHLDRATEQSILLLDESALAPAAATLLQRARDGEIAERRQSAIKKHLEAFSEVPPTADVESRRDALKEAFRLYHEDVSDVFMGLSLLRRHQHVLLFLGCVTLLATLALLAGMTWDGNASQTATGAACRLAALLGVLGAVTSACQRAAQLRPDRLRRELATMGASLSRVPIGAAAGLTVWLFSVATAQGASMDTANLFLAAFGAGFAERLIVSGAPAEPLRDNASP